MSVGSAHERSGLTGSEHPRVEREVDGARADVEWQASYDAAVARGETPPRPPTAPTRAARPAWFLPTVTGVAGFLLGVILVGATIATPNIVSAAQHDAKVSAAKAKDAKEQKALKATFSDALAKCSLSDGPDSQIGDGGYTLTINNEGNNDATGVSYDDLACLIAALNTPAAVRSHIDQTTSLDGRQTETWGKVTMSWTYHPDRGLDAVYQLKH